MALPVDFVDGCLMLTMSAPLSRPPVTFSELLVRREAALNNLLWYSGSSGTTGWMASGGRGGLHLHRLFPRLPADPTAAAVC